MAALGFRVLRHSVWIVPLALATACGTPRLIPPPVPTIDFLGSNDFIITQPYVYRIGSTSEAITVPQGFVTDFASIPWEVRSLLPKQSGYSRAAVVHDYLYWSRICTRAQADNILMIAMKELHVAGWKRRPIYTAVHKAGGAAWSGNAAERQVGKPKVVPPEYYSLATTLSWPPAREKLIAAGVHDPEFPQSPGACALGDRDVVP